KFFHNSFLKRSLMCRDVTYLPSFPEKGESLIVNNIIKEGSSMRMDFNHDGIEKAAIQSRLSKRSIRTTAQISPALTSCTYLRPKPSKVYNSLILDFTTPPSRLINEIFIPSRSVPLCKRPIAIRPVKEEKSKEVINICGVPSFSSAAGM